MIKYDPNHLQDFDTEWGLHERSTEWWYATAIVFDKDGNMYSYQYTLLHTNFGPMSAQMAMLALTDYKSSTHHYLQLPIGPNVELAINEKEASVKGVAEVVKGDTQMRMQLWHKDFHVDAVMDYGKGAFWHCDNGKLQMGIPGERETTEYFSYPNMPTTVTITLGGRKIEATGKTWFDKQGGTYSITDSRTNWEWFSLRFLDDEEIMLFTFPQNDPPYFDGTFISRDGKSERLNTYTIETTAITEFAGRKWSAGWKVHVDKKDQDYIITPIQEGHMNGGYFEECCYVKNAKGELVGYAFAELLPGVLNKRGGAPSQGQAEKSGAWNPALFRRIEF